MTQDLSQEVTQEMTQGFVDDYLPALLAQASALISDEFHAVVQAHGLAVAEWRVLATLASRPPGGHCSTGELAQTTLTKQPTLSRQLSRMQDAGWVQRHDAEGDRRITLVGITPAGLKLVRQLMQQAQAHERRVLEPFGAAQASALKVALKRLIAEHRHPIDSFNRKD